MGTSKTTWIAEDLRERILIGFYPAGERLPTEGRLREIYDASRNTVRNAVKVLENEGRLEIQQGRGIYVRRYRPVVHLASSVQGDVDAEHFRQGYAPQLKAAGYDRVTETIVVGFEIAEGSIARRLDISEESPTSARQVIKRQCDRFVDGRLWERQIFYYPIDIAMNTELMSPVNIERGTVQVLNELGHEQVWTWDKVSARMPTPRESESFRLGVGVPLIVQERTAHSAERAVRLTDTVIPADRHELLYAEGDVPDGLLALASDVDIPDH